MTELTLSIEDRLADRVVESARRYGLPVQEYVERVLRAAETPGAPDREERALELARGAYRHYVDGGRSEDGAVSMEEVFGP
ncbi:hypothetical protein SNE510_06790 [Streptomyces sp. NE5-10]|uniref:hypothetical protein n=1 Tax=Streptomyces sp. NE5-10 TaxID=2759674 RepID=UPI00190719B2|nr:hypothetical protein [Streptomyces sp. NE5-10]GHJ91160.1 hypothetical protein SNE510_06790 [Streptomyces sp. NE5-10]